MKHWNLTMRLLRSCCIALTALYLLVPVSQSWGDPDVPELVPGAGIPYASRTDGPKWFSGSVWIHNFESNEYGCWAVGWLYEKKKVHEATFPVVGVEDDDGNIIIEFGPPMVKNLRLRDGFFVGATEFDRLWASEGSSIPDPEEEGEGYYEVLAAWLNNDLNCGEEENLGSCSWTTKLSCAAAFVKCGVFCVAWTVTCELCLKDNGYFKECLCCFFDCE